MSTPDEDTVKTLIKGLISLLKEGGFELAKFSSNNVSVLEALPNDCLTPALTEVDFRVEELPSHQALGLVWEPQGNYLRIKIAMLSYPSTRRDLLLLVMSLFDPLGVDTANNPANLYSRGVASLQVYKSEKWLKRPTFLIDPECTWPAKKLFVDQALDEDVSELPPISKINLCVNSSRVVSLKEGALGRLITQFSELSRAVRVAAWLLRLKSKLRRRVEGESRGPIFDVIDAREYDVALLSLIALVQRQEFPGLVGALASHPY